jgi:hypothetical protein
VDKWRRHQGSTTKYRISIRFAQTEIKSASRTLELRVFYFNSQTSVSFKEMLNGALFFFSKWGYPSLCINRCIRLLLKTNQRSTILCLQKLEYNFQVENQLNVECINRSRECSFSVTITQVHREHHRAHRAQLNGKLLNQVMFMSLLWPNH